MMAAGRPSSALGPRLWRLAWQRKTVLIGLAILATVTLCAVFAPLLAPYDPGAMRIARRLRPPSGAHLFGTDEFGRDILSRVIYGSRVSMVVGASTVAVSCLAGTVLGICAGYFPRVDVPLARVIDGMMAFPDILLAIALVAVLGPSVGNVVVALGIVYTPRVARIVRASTLAIRQLPFVEAARALGALTPRILRLHVLRNLASPLLVQGTFIFAYAVLAEAGLSFLGVGVSPETPTWGNIISAGQQYVRQADWIMIFPGVAIVLVVFSLQMIGDGLRDLLDPRLRKDF